MKALLQRLHTRLGDFWWYSLMMFAALRCGDVINAVVGLWLVPKYVPQEELGAVLPLTQFASSVGAPMTVLVTVFSKYLNKFKTRGEDGKVKAMILWFVGIAVVLTVITSAVAIAILPHFFERIRVASGSLVLLIIASGIIGTVSPVFTNALQGLKKFRATTVINLLSAPIRLFVMLVAMPFRALSGYMLGQTAAPLFAIATSCIALRKEVRKSVKYVSFWKDDGREIVRYVFALVIWVGVGAVCTPIIMMIVRQRLPEVESSAYYMISRFAELATYAGQTMMFVMFPLASEAHERGGNTLKLLLQSTFGMTVFGLIVTSGFYLVGEWIFRIIPTCRPYECYMTELVIMSLIMLTNILWSSFSTFEVARNRFAYYYIYGGPITVLQTIFLVCFTGYTFFNGLLPESFIDWMASLKIATLRNFLWTQLGFNMARLACATVDIIRQYCRVWT